MRSLLRVFFIFALLLPVIWHGVLSSQDGTTVFAIRWIVAVLWAGAIWTITMDDQTRSFFFKSMLAGCIGCVAVIILQFVGFLELTQQVGLSPKDSVDDVEFLSIWRVPGMEKHVNGSAAVVSLAVPVTIGLLEEKRLGRKWLLIILGLVAVSAAMTLNRSSILVTAATLVAWVMLSKSRWITGWTRFWVVAVAVVALLIYGPPGGWERWSDLFNLGQSSNVKVRVETTLEAARLAMLHPFGMGLEYTEILRQNAGVGSGATHNAFLQIALRGGWPIFFAILIKLGYAAMMLFRRSYLEGWVALHLFGLFFFEEYLSNFTIVILVVWLLLHSLHGRHSSITSTRRALPRIGKQL